MSQNVQISLGVNVAFRGVYDELLSVLSLSLMLMLVAVSYLFFLCLSFWVKRVDTSFKTKFFWCFQADFKYIIELWISKKLYSTEAGFRESRISEKMQVRFFSAVSDWEIVIPSCLVLESCLFQLLRQFFVASCWVCVVTWPLAERNSYHQWLLIGSLFGVPNILSVCERKSTATMLATFMEKAFYAYLAH